MAHSLLFIVYKDALDKKHALKASIFSFLLDAYSTIATLILVSYSLNESIRDGIAYAIGGALITYAYTSRK